MHLVYYKGNNFGDKLNPYIFKHFIPELLNQQDDDLNLLGIGSIIGLDFVKQYKKKIIFSSGFAYGDLPVINKDFDVICVRGPKTAQILNIDKNLAICDGAILLQYMEQNKNEKIYDYSYMPHWESALKFDWKSFCDQIDIHFIDPTSDTRKILEEIKSTKVLFSEAMHGAIVADSLRVPWVPVHAYKGINSFKWMDFTQTLDLPYRPVKLNSLYSDTPFMRKVVREKVKIPVPEKLVSVLLKTVYSGQQKTALAKVANGFEQLKTMEPFLSNDAILKQRGEQLLEKFELMKKKYYRY